MPRRDRVVIDACALYPNLLRDTLLSLAEEELFQFLWTDELLDEVRRNLVENGAAPAAKAERTVALIAQAFPDGRIEGYEARLDEARNDPKDRHVVAAALASEAETIVTFNLRDFRVEDLPEALRVIAPDDFLMELLGASPLRVIAAFRRQASRLRRPPVEVKQLAKALSQSVPRFGSTIEKLAPLRTEPERLRLIVRMLLELEQSKRLGTTSPQAVAALTEYVDAEDAAIPGFRDELIGILREQWVADVRNAAKIARSSNVSAAGRDALRLLESHGLAVEVAEGMSDDELGAFFDRRRNHTQ